MNLDTIQLPLEMIEPNPNQPRQVFDQAKLESLAQSIQALGIIQPIVVELAEVLEESVRYIIHDGERRWRAAKLAGLKEVPCVLSAKNGGADVASEEERLSRALVANLQREDLNPIETAQGYQDLHDLGLSDAKIAKIVGCSRSTVANARRLLQLPDEIRQPVAQGQISERQAQALLPVYQLPPVALEKAASNIHGESPKELIKAAVNGRSSSALRDNVSYLIRRVTTDMTGDPFLAHPFERDEQSPCRSSECYGCPDVLKNGKTMRCPDRDCLSWKKNAWSQLRLAEASEASGLEILSDDIEKKWNEVDYFSGWGEELKAVVTEEGCPHGNLRLEYDQHCFDHYLKVDGYPDIIICCHHGEGTKCKCLAAIKRERNKNDPDRQAEKEGKQRLENEIVAPATQVLYEALAGNEADAWRLLLPRICHVYLDKVQDLSLDDIQQMIARALVNDAVPWNGHIDLEKTLLRVQDKLALAGLALPEADALANLTQRVDRVLGWVEELNEETPLEQIEGNFHNLNELFEGLNELEAENDEQEQAIRGVMSRVAAGVVTLATARDARRLVKRLV